MIKIILILCRFSFVNNFVQNLVFAFQSKQKQIGQVKTLEQSCQEELKSIKEGKKESKIYYQPI